MSVFVDKGVLDINYIPRRLLHRDGEMRLLGLMFDHILSAPYEMSQRAIILGGVGTGKTALAQIFGRRLVEDAKRRHVRARYIHVNCRELRGSLFMVLRRVVRTLRPEFPERGYAANELMDTLMQLLDEEDTQLLLCLDEVDALIGAEGSDAIYNLTRVQEGRPEGPRRLSLICISKTADAFRGLDASTLSSLQRNVVTMSDYSSPQLSDIAKSRAELAFRRDAMPSEIVDFIAELAAAEHGDARYAIDLLWRAGLLTDNDGARQVTPEHVRRAAAGLSPLMREESLAQLSRHELLVLLGIARFFKHSASPHATTGEAEGAYRVVCEEYGEEPRGHTQFWKYLGQVGGLSLVDVRLDASPQGRTQLISLRVPAAELERGVVGALEQV